MTFASWWNPSSWFESHKPTVQTPTPTVIPTLSPEIIKDTPPEKVTEKVIEKPVEKVVTKIVTNTVTVDNPNLIKQIDALKIENANWKASFDLAKKDRKDSEDKLNARIQDLENQLVAVKNSSSNTQSVYDAKRKEILTKIAEVDLEIPKENEYYFSGGFYCGGGDGCERDIIHQKRLSSLNIRKAELQLELTKL